MRILNIIIVVVLIAMTVYMFHHDNISNRRINYLNESLKESRVLIDSLYNENGVITNEVGLLKDSVVRYKSSIVVYNDSLVKIKNRYEIISNSVYILDDSTSVDYFKQYLQNYSNRYGKDSN